jgi:hypothetical protein
MNTPEESKRIEEYLRQRDSLVQLKERESSLPSSYGESMGWVLYCLWAIPLSVVMVLGGEIAGPSVAIFAIIFIIKGWLEDGEKLVKEEEEARFGKKKKRKLFYRVDENGNVVEDSP